MSASDAAPLPRLGEVFFDVRGNSRSMRLSWYADTDVAVFSIWQGGKCTGTFRLPMDDLSRMIEILQRGPEGRSGRRATRPPERPTAERARGPGERGYDSDRTVVHRGPEPRPEGRGTGEYGPGDYLSGDYGPPDHPPADYDDLSQSRSARHRTERYESADYGRPDYEQPAYEQPAYEQDDGWFPDGDSYQSERTGQRFLPADDPGYGQERFAPPYSRPRPDSSEPGFMDDSEYGLPADPAVRSRHSAGRHSGGQGR